ncbi:D-glycerate 2-kinase [archaeon HR06]|nr:D-glycerate 2-kinase [archaeon HR06]
MIIKNNIFLKGKELKIKDKFFDLSLFNRIFVIGGGKASGAMAEALEEILGERIEEGYVNILEGQSFKTKRIKLIEATHPFPSEKGVKGVELMLNLLKDSDEKDLIICLISGGGSSLLPMPVEGISIEEKGNLSLELMRRGANIYELNAVRKHLSKIKGGWLAKWAYPSTVISLIISDVVGDRLDTIASGPTAPDKTTYQDAINVLKKYELWENLNERIKDRFLKGLRGEVEETPKEKDECFKKVHNIIIANNKLALLKAKDYLEGKGIKAEILTSSLKGEAREAGTFIGSLIQEAYLSNRSLAFLLGGETTVTVRGKGKGGRNQELALSCSFELEGMEGVVLASMSSDGIDGSSDAAGALVDGKTIIRAKNLGLEPLSYLRNNDSYTFFSKLKDYIYTGPTGTNVNDFIIALIIPHL